MLNYTEVTRVNVHGNEDEVRRIVKRAEPVIFEEGDSRTFGRIIASWTPERLLEVFGDRDHIVSYRKKGHFDINVPFSWATKEMLLSDFIEKIRFPDQSLEYYLRISSGEDLAKPLFQELMELRKELAVLTYRNLNIDTIWIGGAENVTPMHYDPYARFHGVVRGEKLFIMFPPDFRHYRTLDTYSVRSPAGWYSGLGIGPIDSNVFPKLKKTKPWRALLRPGDMLFMPSLWWHHVSITNNLTISISRVFRPWNIYLHWYFWRRYLADRLEGQKALISRLEASGHTRPPLRETAEPSSLS